MSNYQKAVLEFRRWYWRIQLAKHKSVRLAALAAGVNRTYLHEHLIKLGLREKDLRYYGNWGDLADTKGRDS
jgi:hypothetical protein